MPTPPALTTEQRRQAWQRSLELRRFRAIIKEDIANGGLDWFKLAWTYEQAQGMKVYDLLVSLPGVGHRTAVRLLAEAKIPEKNTVRGCGPKQRERLFAALEDMRKPRP